MKLSFSRLRNEASNVESATCHCICTIFRPAAEKTVIVFKTFEESAVRTYFHAMVHFLRPYQRRKKTPSSETRVVPCSVYRARKANPARIATRKSSKGVAPLSC